MEILSFYTCAPKTTIIWDTVLKMQSETGHFWPLTPLTTQKFKILKKREKTSGNVIILHISIKNLHHITYDWSTLFTSKINIWKIYKKYGDIILLQMCTINEYYMMHGTWDIRHDWQSFLLFWAIFCLLTLLITPKSQNFVKMKKLPRDIIILHLCTINKNHIMYGSWEKDLNRQNLFSFWTILCPFWALI